MSDIYKKFYLMNDFGEGFKRNIKLFYVFKNDNESNVFIVTNDDKVFALEII
jgi:hypothetical protein